MDNIANWKRFIFLYTVFLIHMIYPTISRLDFAKSSCPDARSYITPNSTYQENLETLLSSVSSGPQFITYGIYNHSAGEEPNRVNAVALCVGDISMDICRVCVDESSRKILEDCPNQKAAIVWYDQCLLRYSGSGNYNWGRESIFNGNKASSDPDRFVEAVKSLMGRLREEAASGDSTRKLGWGEISAGNETVYGLVQCIPDMSSTDCESCVGEGLVLISDARIGGRIFMGGCVLRYENYSFSNLTTNASPSSSLVPIAGSKKSKGKITVIVVIVVSILTTVILFIGICLVLRMRRRKCEIPSDEVQIKGIAFQETTDEISNVETIQFDFETIKVATNEFSDENKFGEGGFGVVYKGKLSNGQNIAVKRLSKDSNQGDMEFKNEVLVVAKLQHRNLVKLLGFSLDGNERLLIYEFLPNGSLDHFIFDLVKRTILDWETRYKIINGIARGLLYLPEDSRVRIIHRVLKASNILLDGKMNPKIADFGMTRLFELDETQAHTKRIVGTDGYLAPEYAYHRQFSPKSNVFSFGVLILEIISGQKNICFSNGEEDENLLSFAWKSWRAGKPENVIDTILISGSDAEIIHIGLLCIQENVVDRPTMASVVLMLNSCSLTLSIPSEPAFFLHTNNFNSNVHNSQTAPLPTSENGISVSDFYPR